MANWCLCDVEVTHDDPTMIDRVMRASSPYWLYLFREFLPGHEYAPTRDEPVELVTRVEPDAAPHLGTRVERLSPISASVSLNSKYAPPIELFDRMVELGYHVKGRFDDECMMYSIEYDDGVKEKTCPVLEHNEKVMAEAAKTGEPLEWGLVLLQRVEKAPCEK
jgi:hypothetical protein